MNLITHPSNNHIFKKPDSMTDEECSAMPATVVQYCNGIVIHSFWKPTVEELELLNANGSVMLGVFSNGQPPVSLQVVEQNHEFK